LLFFIAEILQPINCILISEEVPKVSIVLNERKVNYLKGKIFSGKEEKGFFYTRRPTSKKSANWSFESSNIIFSGEILLLRDQEIWHQFQNKIEGNQVNRVLFSGLASNLKNITSEIDLLKASSGFFRIGSGCYGGKINKV